MRTLIHADVVGTVYAVRTGTSGVSLRPQDTVLRDVRVADGELRGPDVTVATRCVLVEADAEGRLRGVPMEPLHPVDGTLCFDPRAGGVRTRENRRAAGEHNEPLAEAMRFGMVNAFHHVGLAARLLNRLLRDLGAAPLPHLRVVVGAHSGSQLPGFSHGDGDFRRGHLLPFSGGHYRLSQITSGVPEPFPVAPTGEMHLGPGRRRHPFAGSSSYLANAAHNPATIYHEYGHHLCRHTADFRLNAERAPSAQRNGKTAVEEGVCDYLAASMLGTGQPYGWFRPALGARRDPEWQGAWHDGCAADVHAAGAVWAAALWRLRGTLVQEGALASPRDHDRAVVAALLQVGATAVRTSGGRATGGRRRRERRAVRSSPSTMIDAYLGAIRAAGGAGAADRARRSLHALGLPPERGLIGDAPPC
jgi:hypothetical protein